MATREAEKQENTQVTFAPAPVVRSSDRTGKNIEERDFGHALIPVSLGFFGLHTK